MELQCPACSGSLQGAFYEGTPVHLCSGCRGVFLGKQGLQEIAQKRDKIIPRNLPTPRRGTEEAPLHCPRCRVPMKKGKYGKLRQTTFDMCEQCSNLWLDQGELESIQLDFEMVSDNRAKSKAGGPASPRAMEAAAEDGGPPKQAIGGRLAKAAEDGGPPKQAIGGRLAKAAEDGGPSKQAIGGPASSRADLGFRCPKCNHPQARGESCVRCGIVFAKYEAMQQARTDRAEQDANTAARMDEIYRQMRGFDVQQQYHLTEAIIGFERANRYTAQPVGVNSGTWRIEESNRSGFSILGRNLFGSLYTFTMQVLDDMRKTVLTFERRARFYFYHLDIFDENGREIGSARRRFSWFRRLVTVHDENNRELVRIVGPYFSPWTFHLRREDAEAGIIEKKWSGGIKELYTDADRFAMRFENNLDAKMRRLLLGAMMLIDSLYFEGRKPFLRHFFDAPGAQVIIVLAILGFMLSAADVKLPARSTTIKTPPALAAVSGQAIQQRELTDLIAKGHSLSDLARRGQYTVVEVYLDTCPICRQLESGFGRFTAKRPDVLIKRVHVPENGGIMVSADDRNARAMMESICGTPHVEIYGPDRQPLALDKCGTKAGTRYLRNWIATETSMSLRDLLTSAGADASTPISPGK